MKRTALVLGTFFAISSVAFAQSVQKGDFAPSVASEGWALAAGTGDRTFIEFITFDKPFDAPPTVLVSLSGFDATADNNGTVRVHVGVDKVTKVGCVVKIKAWGNSKVNAVYGSWLAINK